MVEQGNLWSRRQTSGGLVTIVYVFTFGLPPPIGSREEEGQGREGAAEGSPA